MNKLRQYFNTKTNSFVLLLLAIWTGIIRYLPVDPLTPEEIAGNNLAIVIFTATYFIVDTIENKE